MKWLRLVVSVLFGCAVSIVILYTAIDAFHGPLVMLLNGILVDDEVLAKMVFLALIPGTVVAALLYSWRKPLRDDDCRCRNCGYILRGLIEPRCSEWWEPI